MKHAQRRQDGKGGLELIEEAVHLVRGEGLSHLATYYLGALPFVLGLLYFWAEMSRSAYAERRLPLAALGLAILFVWMKFWQAIFARQLRSRLAGGTPKPPSAAETWDLLVQQAFLQPSALFFLPLALITILPFGWVCAFYENLTASPRPGTRASLKHAQRMAWLWPRQNHTLLAALGAFAFAVFLNWSLVCYLLPALAKMLFAVESAFTRSGASALNTTYFAVVFALTYLSVDPIVKAAYALRCFYGESLESGEDLRAELKRITAPPPQALAALLCLLLLPAPVLAAHPDDAPGVSGKPAIESPGAVDPAHLDQAIEEVIQQRKYTWRMPREKLAEPKEQGVILRFLSSIGQAIDDFIRWVTKWFRRTQGSPVPASPGGSIWDGGVSLTLLKLLLIFAVVAVILLLARTWRLRRRGGSDPVEAQPLQPAVDLTDETLGADQLPEDGWTRLGRELLAKGEYRLALRAFYLSTLAHLGEHHLVTLARFKSNRDYERELARRAHALPAVPALFGESVLAFERVWYGSHPADQAQVELFLARTQELKGGSRS